ncbi:MAG: hypothetical protein L0Z54_04690, partial [Thermoplasmata archaeon]|nr:hypothetical protein [Thermoplasmata archaeon]
MAMKRAFAIAVVLVLLLAGTAAVSLLSERPEIYVYEKTIVNADIIVTVKNLGTAPAYDIPLRMAIPVDHERTQSLRDLRFETEPERRTNDTHGNEFVHYTIDQLDAQESVELRLHVSVVLRSIDFNVRDSGTCECDENMSRYLWGSPLITMSDPAVVDLSREIARGSSELV